MQNKVGSVHYIHITLVAALAISAIAASAQTPAPIEVKKKWETTAAVTLALTKGNTDTALTTATLETKRKWEKDEAMFGLAAGYGENSGNKNTEFINGFGQYNRSFSERFYGGLRLDGNYDGIANLDYRVRLSPLLGYYLIKEAKTKMVVEAGPSFVREQYGETDNNNNVTNTVIKSYVGLRLGEKLEHKLSDTTKLWQSVEYIPAVDSFVDRFVITFEAGIDTAITKQWSLRVAIQDIYNNEPGAGNKKNDMRLMAGTSYKF